MQIEKVQIKVRDLVEGYINDDATGRVSGMDGKLDIRPEYQRNFIYKEKQQNAVIDTVMKGFPLNTMYWAKTGDDTYEVLDGQQRTISICQYVAGAFSVDFRYFHNLSPAEKDKILDYELDVYKCSGTDTEKLEWFKTINIAGEKLTAQELRNAVYAGPWLAAAKKKFSAPNSAAYRAYKDYLSGSAIRQEYLETALTWIANNEGCKLEEYMARHQHDANADELWEYIEKVFDWVKAIFTTYRKEMKGIAWGMLYNQLKNEPLPNATIIEQRVKELMADEDITSKSGIYEYVLTGNERVLSVRTFSPAMKREAYERQNHRCPWCINDGVDKDWAFEEMEGDHITPWSQGGRTTSDNCQMLCKPHNRLKSGR